MASPNGHEMAFLLADSSPFLPKSLLILRSSQTKACSIGVFFFRDEIGQVMRKRITKDWLKTF